MGLLQQAAATASGTFSPAPVRSTRGSRGRPVRATKSSGAQLCRTHRDRVRPWNNCRTRPCAILCPKPQTAVFYFYLPLLRRSDTKSQLATAHGGTRGRIVPRTEGTQAGSPSSLRSAPPHTQTYTHTRSSRERVHIQRAITANTCSSGESSATLTQAPLLCSWRYKEWKWQRC